MVNYVTTFEQFGAELQNMRKSEALFEQHHYSDNANYSKRLVDAVYDVMVNEEDEALTVAKNSVEAAAQSILGIHASQKSNFENGFFPVLDQEIPTSALDQRAGAIQYIYDSVLEATGQIAIIERRGRFGALRRQMILDVQSILKNNVTFGAFTAGGANQGVLAVAASPVFAGADHMFSGTLIFEVDSDTVDAPKIKVSHLLSKQLLDGTTLVQAAKLLQVGKSYEEGISGLTAQLDLGPIVKSGDAAGPLVVLAPAPTLTLPSEGDTDRGLFYLRVTRMAVAPIWLLEWFNDADTANPANLVQRVTTDTIVGTVALTMSRTSTFSFTFDRAAANVDLPLATNTRTITFDIKTPRIGDRWTRTVTNDEAGNFATKLGKRYRVSLNSLAVPTITDADAASISFS